MSKYEKFMQALEALCNEHEVTLELEGNEGYYSIKIHDRPSDNKFRIDETDFIDLTRKE